VIPIACIQCLQVFALNRYGMMGYLPDLADEVLAQAEVLLWEVR